MSSTVFILVVVLGLVLIAAATAAYYIARRLRGTIRVVLDRRGYNPGEQITGSFVLTTRKSIEGKRLFAALLGKEVTRESYRDSNNRMSTRTKTREVYRYEQTIEEAKTYAAGQTTEYQFQLDTPPAMPGSELSQLGESLKAGLSLLGGQKTHLEWYVTVRLDAEGIDLSGSEDVAVNL